MPGFTKLFSTILSSTIWGESDQVRLVWITMLALSDQFGQVFASVPGLAYQARVPVEATREALRVLESPDRDSRTKLYDGCRILEIDGGWKILNYIKYREARNADERREYLKQKQQEHRDKKRLSTDTSTIVNNRQQRQPASTQAEAEAEAEADKYSEQTERVIFDLPVIGGEVYSVPESLYTTYRSAYPGVNVMTEFAKMNAWLVSNPLKKKTFKGMPRFMNTWLEKAQNGGPRSATLFSPPEPEPRRIKSTVGVSHD